MLAAATDGTFHWRDWLVLAGYFLLLIFTGVWFSRRKQGGTEGYFLAERQMPVWAVAISVVASSLSAATFIGAPLESYTGDLRYLSTNIGGLLAVAVVAVFFIPVFYKHNVATVYGMLEGRFGGPAKLAASGMFMIGRVFASGARLFMSAIPLAMILFGDFDNDSARDQRHLLIAVAALTVAGSLYTIVGGIRSVIWTEVIQTAVLVGAVIAAAVWLLVKIPLPVGEIFRVLGETPTGPATHKLTWLTSGLDASRPGFGFDPAQTYTLLTAIFGFSLLGIASYGTDHDLVQRMLTCRSAAKGSWSAVMGILIGIPITALFLLIGLLLYVFYQRPDILGAAMPAYAVAPGEKKVFPLFILREMRGGLAGLMIAGLFAAGLSTLMSALNAMASTFVNDYYRPAFAGRSEKHYLLVGRLGVLGWGLILGLFACFCVYWQKHSGQTLIQFALSVMTFAYAGLLGVFFTALFTRRGNNASAVAALAVGFLAVLVMQPEIWAWLRLDRLPVGAGRTLGPMTLAFPWKLPIATALAVLVCCLGTADKATLIASETGSNGPTKTS